ncbi:MAG: hypothetical protein WB425_16060 [Terracidiphilus sp.]|jgi:hypothetical protein
MGESVNHSSNPKRRFFSQRKLLIAFLCFFVGILATAIPTAISDFRYYHRRDVITTWNGVEFRLPAPWFQRELPDANSAVFLRDQLPWTQGHGIPYSRVRRSLAMISVLPADDSFHEYPQATLDSWEKSSRKKPVKYWANQISSQRQSVLTATQNAKGEFHCANFAFNGLDGKSYLYIDCISLRDGWRFDYEGLQEHGPEALSILTSSR